MVEANKHIFVKHFLGLMRLMTSAQCQQTADDWFNKGVALDDPGKYEEAIKAYDRAIEINPQDTKAWYNKGTVLKALGRTIEADAAFTKAKELGSEG
jgi:tetratricopeptide (TPR) repeat protein